MKNRFSAGIAVVFLLLITMPLSSEAGLIRVNFDMELPTGSGMGYLQFDDTTFKLGVMNDISLLRDAEYRFSASWYDLNNFMRTVAIDLRTDDVMEARGGLMIEQILNTNVYIASFDSDFWLSFKSFDEYGGVANVHQQLWLRKDGMAEVYHLLQIRPEYGTPALSMYRGTYAASVWFDDPLPVPIPPSGLLSFIGLLPLVGVIRWCHA